MLRTVAGDEEDTDTCGFTGYTDLFAFNTDIVAGSDGIIGTLNKKSVQDCPDPIAFLFFICIIKGTKRPVVRPGASAMAAQSDRCG